MSWLTLPLPVFLQWQLPEALVRPVLHGLVVVTQDAERFAADVKQFDEWARDLVTKRTEAAERRRIALLEIEARLRRLALIASHGKKTKTARLLGQCEYSQGAGELSRVEQMTGFIAQHYQEPLQICR
jgi:hypothetical protein